MLDNKGYLGAMMMDLSKSFDTINYELLVVNVMPRNLLKKHLKVH